MRVGVGREPRQEQIHRALQPLGSVPEQLAENVASELLVCGLSAKEGAEAIVQGLLACDSIDIGDIAVLAALPDVEKAWKTPNGLPR